MLFRPAVNSKIRVSSSEYSFTEHPAAKGIPYGQTGRRATVYQLKDSLGQLYGLKVFNNAFRTAQTENTAKQIAAFSKFPGLQVCSRIVLTHQNAAGLLGQHPDLEYAVLMPWVQGQTWQEIILGRQPLTPEKSLNLAWNFSSILASMEKNRIAHCDLSGSNLLILRDEVYLVDVEDLYAPSLYRPAKLPAGSAGYGHKTAADGLWQADADRFAGAVLIAEMLAWCDELVRQMSMAEQYFDGNELQISCDRYRLLSTCLKTRWGSAVLHLLDRIWSSENLSDCPTLTEWQTVLLSLKQPELQMFQTPLLPSHETGPVVSWRKTVDKPVSQPNPISSALDYVKILRQAKKVFSHTGEITAYLPQNKASSKVLLKNFIVDIEIDNPYPTGKNIWGYAISFREKNINNALYLYITSDNAWWLSLNKQGIWKTIARGMLQNLNTLPNGSNYIRLFAYEGIAHLYINSEFAVALDVSDDQFYGDISLLANTGIASKILKYRNFIVWGLP